MEANKLTLKVLTEIRDEVREVRNEQKATRGELHELREDMNRRFSVVDERFVVVETTLRDLARQMVMLAHGLKKALESRAEFTQRLDTHERRLDALEKRSA